MHEAYDVAILGTGIGGSLLGAILAKQRLRVLLIDSGQHPRFAIGESTIPETTIMLRLLARRFGVPEIAELSNFNSVRTHVSSACGVKRNFSFVYHREHQRNDPRETTQFPTWAPPFGPDVHFFRQDVDAYACNVAVSYGATARMQTRVTAVEIDDRGVRLKIDSGEEIAAKFVVDAGGIQAPIARMLDLRQTPPPLQTQSRTLYSHMIGVRPYEQVGTEGLAHNMPSPFCQGTLHHLFKGGWMWVIPFDNHPTSTNSLCSVGVTLDPRVHPAHGATPADEFAALIARYPSVATQFANARAVRPWLAADRLQFWSKTTCGERFWLLPHAGAFIDPLFSSGLAITMFSLNLMAPRIIKAVTTGDFAGADFGYVDTWVKNCFSYYDRLVSCSYASFADFELWNAWHRVWMLGSLYGVTGLFEALSRFERTQDHAEFALLERPPYRAVQAYDWPVYRELFESAAREVEACARGEQSVSRASSEIYRLIRESRLSPTPWGLEDPERRCPGTFTLLPMMRLVAWGRYRSPESVRAHYFITGRSQGLIREVARTAFEQVRVASGIARSVVRDATTSWNTDWKLGRPKSPELPV